MLCFYFYILENVLTNVSGKIGTRDWCPPLHTFRSNYVPENKTLSVSFEGANFGVTTYELYIETEDDILGPYLVNKVTIALKFN